MKKLETEKFERLRFDILGESFYLKVNPKDTPQVKEIVAFIEEEIKRFSLSYPGLSLNKLFFMAFFEVVKNLFFVENVNISSSKKNNNNDGENLIEGTGLNEFERINQENRKNLEVIEYYLQSMIAILEEKI
jgi:hypothetical protein